MLRRTLLRLLTFAAAGLPLTAQAQDQAAGYPGKVVTLVVPFPAGGSSDTMGRLVAQELSASLGQTFIVENKPGANGTIGTAQVARAEPDGYTLLLSGVGSNAINHTLYPKLGYEPEDLSHITLLATGPNVLVANPELEAKSFKAFLELARVQPGELNYASSGNGSSGPLAMEMLKQAAGIDLLHVPYKGGAPAMTDVIGGQVPVLFINQDAALPHVQAGKMVALAVASPERNPAYPDTPTIAEAGFPGFAAQSWFGLSAPAGTPEPILGKLQGAAVKALQSPALRQRLEKNGFVVVGGPQEDYAAWIEAETEKWAQVIEASGAKIE